MCHYITATLPHGVKPESVAPLFESHKLGFEVVSNPHVASQIEVGDWYVLTTRGHCDCGTALGSLKQGAAGDAVRHEHGLRRFRWRGWRAARIGSWVGQKEKTKEGHLREEEESAQRSTLELDQWAGCITDVLTAGRARSIGLL